MKASYLGAGVALTAGLLLGVAMKPDLGVDDRPAGPQIFEGFAGAPSTGPFDDTGRLAAYGGKTPDYVLGTDWKKMSEPAPAAELQTAAAPGESRPGAALRDESQVVRFPADQVTAANRGELDDAYDDASRAEKTPLAQTVSFDEDAPPEATGDTTPAR